MTLNQLSPNEEENLKLYQFYSQDVADKVNNKLKQLGLNIKWSYAGNSSARMAKEYFE